MKNIVSVLLPSRGRPELLRKSIESLGEGNFEVLVRYDSDDKTMPLKNVGKNVRLIKGDRVGYKNFHLMINELCEQAASDWLMLWNDDALMESKDWLNAFTNYDSKKATLLNFFDTENMNNNLFPVMSRSMYEAIGHFSLSTHCDTWAQDIANGTGTHHKVDGIRAKHIRESINDETKNETQAVYSESSPEYFSEDMKLLRDQDMQKIRSVL